RARFEVSNRLEPKIYGGSITLEFLAPAGVAILSNGKTVPEQTADVTDRWDQEYFRRDGEHVYVTVRSNTTLEFSPREVSAVDVTGIWKLRYTTENGLTRDGVLDLTTEGGKLAGSLSCERGAARIEKGGI